MSGMSELPPELRGVRFDDDDAPRRPRPIVLIVTWLCIIGLVMSVAAGFFSSF